MVTKIISLRSKTTSQVDIDKINNILVQSNEFYSELEKIENNRRGEFQLLRLKIDEPLLKLEKELEEISNKIENIQNKIKEKKIKNRSKKVDNQDKLDIQQLKFEAKKKREEIKNKKNEINEILKPGNQEFEKRCKQEQDKLKNYSPKTLGKVIQPKILEQMLNEDWPEFWKQSKKIDFNASNQVKELSNKSELFNGQKNLIIDQISAAKKKKKSGKLKRKNTLCEGRIGVQVQKREKKYICVDDIIAKPDAKGNYGAKSQFLQILPLTKEEWEKRTAHAASIVDSINQKKVKPEDKIIYIPISYDEYLRGFDTNTLASQRHFRKHAFVKTRVRIGTIPKTQEPIWLELETMLDRELQRDWIISYAWFNIYKVGLSKRYEFQLTVKTDYFKHDGKINTKEAAIQKLKELEIFKSDYKTPKTTDHVFSWDLGWREGNSCGYWQDDLGNHGPITLPVKPVNVKTGLKHSVNVKTGLKHCEYLHSISDKHFNNARNLLKEWLKKNSISWLNNDKEWCEKNYIDLKYIHTWKSHKKLAKIAFRWINELIESAEAKNLWNAWKNYRLSNKLDLIADNDICKNWLNSLGYLDNELEMAFYLNIWRKKNKHLYLIESNLRDKIISNRNNNYKIVARCFEQIYKHIIVEGNFDSTDEDLDLSDLQEKPEIENDEDVSNNRSTKQIVAPSILRTAFKEVFGNRLIREPAKDTSRKCLSCNFITNQKSKEEFLQCENCNVIEHRDYRSTKNLIKSYFERFGALESMASTRNSENTVIAAE